MSEGRRIADQLSRSVTGIAWHGPSIMELLDDVSADEAREHPVPGVHSIAELVPHITAWATAALRGLDGEAVELTDAENWPAVTEGYDWAAHLRQLRDTMSALGDRTKTMTDDALSTKVHGAGQVYPAYALLHGVVQHNLYHAGQLALLKKVIRSR